VAFAPQGLYLAVGCNDHRVFLLERSDDGAYSPVKGFPLEGASQQHAGRVFGVAFSADGQTLASASQDGTVKLWGVSTRQLHATLRGHEDRVVALAFSPPHPESSKPSSTVLASADEGGFVRFWRASPPP